MTLTPPPPANNKTRQPNNHNNNGPISGGVGSSLVPPGVLHMSTPPTAMKLKEDNMPRVRSGTFSASQKKPMLLGQDLSCTPFYLVEAPCSHLLVPSRTLRKAWAFGLMCLNYVLEADHDCAQHSLQNNDHPADQHDGHLHHSSLHKCESAMGV